MILLSAHLDRPGPGGSVKATSYGLSGDLDNHVGVAAVYGVAAGNVTLRRWVREGKVAIYHSQAEEWGELFPRPPRLTRRDLAVAVDVCAGRRYRRCEASLENVSLPMTRAKRVAEALRWEGFRVRLAPYTGDPDDEDEAWYFRRLRIPAVSFIIPIQSRDGDAWHRPCAIAWRTWSRAVDCLTRAICYFSEWYT